MGLLLTRGLCMAIETIKRTSTAEAIVAHFEEMIRRGQLGPGDRLPSERELQASLGVSRMTLREALARLSALGIIHVEHGRGGFVCAWPDPQALGGALLPLLASGDSQALQELAQARRLIEGELAALAAQRRSADDLDRLAAVLARADQAAGDAERFAELDYAFHAAVAQAAGNRFLSLMFEAINRPMRDFLRDYARSVQDVGEAMERHRPVLEAIAAQDAERARKVAAEHMEYCKARLEAFANSNKR